VDFQSLLRRTDATGSAEITSVDALQCFGSRRVNDVTN